MPHFFRKTIPLLLLAVGTSTLPYAAGQAGAAGHQPPYYMSGLLADNRLPPMPIDSNALDGVDSDYDGVRDDVQRRIFIKYRGDLDKLNSAMQLARALQAALAVPRGAADDFAIYNEMDRAGSCVAGLFPTGVSDEISRDVVSWMKNTDARVDEIDYRRNLNQAYESTWDMEKAPCDFAVVQGKAVARN